MSHVHGSIISSSPLDMAQIFSFLQQEDQTRQASTPGCFPHITTTTGSWTLRSSSFLQRKTFLVLCELQKVAAEAGNATLEASLPFPPASIRKRNSNYLAFQIFPPPGRTNSIELKQLCSPLRAASTQQPPEPQEDHSRGWCPKQGALLEQQGWSLPPNSLAMALRHPLKAENSS